MTRPAKDGTLSTIVKNLRQQTSSTCECAGAGWMLAEVGAAVCLGVSVHVRSRWLYIELTSVIHKHTWGMKIKDSSDAC
jgi:hypothetical protein